MGSTGNSGGIKIRLYCSLQKWNPVVKHRFDWISEALSHQLENLQKQGQKGLECGQQYLLPHFERAKQFVDPYVQVCPKFCAKLCPMQLPTAFD